MSADTVTIPKGFPGRLRRARLKAGLSQVTLAEKAATHQELVSQVEAGDLVPPVLVLMRLAEATGAGVEWLLYGNRTRPARLSSSPGVIPAGGGAVE